MVHNMDLTCLVVFGTLFLSQVQAHRGPHLGEDNGVNDFQSNLHQIWKQNLMPTLSNLQLKSHDSLNQYWVNAKATINKLKTCNPQTQLQLMNLANLKFSDFEACVNATKDIADFEQFLIETFEYCKDIVITNIDLFKNIFSCRSEPNLFDFAKCVVSSLQESGPEFDRILDNAKVLISELQNDTTKLVTHVKDCFGFHKNDIHLNPIELFKLSEESEFINEALYLINDQC